MIVAEVQVYDYDNDSCKYVYYSFNDQDKDFEIDSALSFARQVEAVEGCSVLLTSKAR